MVKQDKFLPKEDFLIEVFSLLEDGRVWSNLNFPIIGIGLCGMGVWNDDNFY